ncbi:MAG TPA: CDP-alcohol phosphatidyltransferase family protein [Streptosporangiaceae bacterium]|nr:CDP-alcohol phosphatidyltransferase family protein [Streptosporangiaceae bacterium]
MSGPSLAELRATGQPQSVTARRNEEHWAGRFYMRRLSPYGTWVFARLGWSPNAVTWLMIVIGVGAGAVVAIGGLATAIAAAVMIQVYLLLDCSDGELARWSRRTSVTGIYLDRVGHYLAEAALLAGVGIRAQGHYALSGGYVTIGLAAAICAILIKAETDNVIVARGKAGLPIPGSASSANGAGGAVAVPDGAVAVPDGAQPRADEALEPANAGLARARRLASALRLHRINQAVELSLLVVVAAAIDAVRGGLGATRVLVVACLVVGVAMVAAHLVAILASRRLG